MDQDSLDFNIKLNDEQTIPEVDIEQPKVKQEGIGSEPIDTNFSKQNTMLSETQSVPQPTSAYDLKAAAHPGMCLFTFAFKVASIFFYFLLGSLFSDITVFIVVLLLNCADFWTVKNITARFLVGLRWWNEFNENGEEIWLYESMPVDWEAHSVDKTIFWTSQMVAVSFYALWTFFKLLSISPLWTILNGICLGLHGTNFYGFYKCRGQHQKKGKELIGKFGIKALSRFS